MRGQVINVDFAVAAGLFVVGIATALTISFTLWQAPQDDLEDRLTSEALQTAENFETEVGWEIRRKKFSGSEGLQVVEFSGGDYYVSSGQDVVLDSFENYIVFDPSSNFSVYSSDKGLENISGSKSFSFDSDSFSNDNITVNYSAVGLSNYFLEGNKLVETVEMEDSNIENYSSGNVSAFVDYGGQKMFMYGGSENASRDVFISSTGSRTNLTVVESLDTLEIPENGTSYNLNQSQTINGGNPLVFHNGDSLAVTGPGMEWHLESSQNSDTELSINGSYYISGWKEAEEAERRAKESSEFQSRFSRNLSGVKMSEAEELFNHTSIVFENDLGISTGLSYNISFAGMHKGENIPLTGTVISRNIPQVVLRPNGTTVERDLEVRLWR